MKRLFLTIFTLVQILNQSVYSVELKEVVEFATKNAPQFTKSELETRSSLEKLKNILSMYDSIFRIESTTSRSRNVYTSSKEDYFGVDSSLSKNIGAGINIGISYETGKAIKIPSGSVSYDSNVRIDLEMDVLRNFLGRVDKNTVLLGEKSSKILKLSLVKARDTLIYGIVVTYIRVLNFETLLNENEALYKSVLKLEKATIKKKKIGSASDRHVFRMKAKTLDFKMKNMEIKRQLNVARDTLFILTGKVFKNLLWPVNSLFIISERSSFNLRKLKIEKSKLQLELDNSRFEMLPQLKLSIGYGMESVNGDGTIYYDGLNETERSISLYMVFPFENTEAKSKKKSLQFSLFANEMSFRIENAEFRRKINEYKSARMCYREQILIAEKIINLQTLRYNEELRAYAQGRSGINDINTALNDLINSRIMLLEKKVSYYGPGFQELFLVGSLEENIIK